MLATNVCFGSNLEDRQNGDGDQLAHSVDRAALLGQPQAATVTPSTTAAVDD
jgi:hypothetical protein